MMHRFVRLIAITALLAVGVAGTALAVTPAAGQYAVKLLRSDKVQVLPGSHQLYVYLIVKYKGAYTHVTLPRAVKIVNGKIAYTGKVTFQVYSGTRLVKVPGTGTVTGRFTSAKRLTLSFTLRQGSFKATRTETLKFVTANQS